MVDWVAESLDSVDSVSVSVVVSVGSTLLAVLVGLDFSLEVVSTLVVEVVVGIEEGIVVVKVGLVVTNLTGDLGFSLEVVSTFAVTVIVGVEVEIVVGKV